MDEIEQHQAQYVALRAKELLEDVYGENEGFLLIRVGKDAPITMISDMTEDDLEYLLQETADEEVEQYFMDEMPDG